MNFAKCLRTTFILTEHLRKATSCVYLEFWEVLQNTFFIDYLRETAISCESYRISAIKYSKKYFTDAFQAFCTRIRTSHSKGFICLISLTTTCEEVNLQWSCEMPICKFTKKNSFTRILLHVFHHGDNNFSFLTSVSNSHFQQEKLCWFSLWSRL